MLETAHNPPPDDLDTRQRLLEVAGAVFAELGFRGATVRDICQRANTNVASIHYHFGDKEGLYHALLESAIDAAEVARPHAAPEQFASPEDELAVFLRVFLGRLYGGGVPAWLMKILSREMFEPTGALEQLVRAVHRPTTEHLRGIVMRIGRGRMGEGDAVRCTQSIIAQCVFYKHAQAVLRLMGHAQPATQAEIEALAVHVTRFSIAGIRASASNSEEDR